MQTETPTPETPVAEPQPAPAEPMAGFVGSEIRSDSADNYGTRRILTMPVGPVLPADAAAKLLAQLDAAQRQAGDGPTAAVAAAVAGTKSHELARLQKLKADMADDH